ncbi:MAG: hypothetical protein ACKVH1_13220 [Alphaproteobacteria bacterium]
MGMTAVMVGAAALSAFSQIRQGQAQKAMMNAQAQQTMIQARSGAIKARTETLAFKQNGIKVMEAVRRNLSTINARGAAGAIDPFSGSTGNLMTATLAAGADDYYTMMENQRLSQENEKITLASGRYQANIYREAGRQAMQSAYIGAATTMASAGAQAYGSGAFSGAPSNAGYFTSSSPGGSAPTYTSSMARSAGYGSGI